MLTRACRRRIHPKTLAADKGYHVKDFVSHLREHQIRPHISRIDTRNTPGLDGRTTRTEGYLGQPAQTKTGRGDIWLAQDGGWNEKAPIHWPGENTNGRFHFWRGVQPAENCEIDQFGDGGMKSPRKWAIAARLHPHFDKSKRIEMVNIAVKSL